ARAHAERLRETSVQTARGRRLRDEGAQLLDARADALATYQTVLERGLVEDLALLESIQEQRQAEEAIGAYLDRLAAIRPLAVEEDEEEAAPRRRGRSRDTPRSGGGGPRPATR
ncbi:MAG TPA: hypothetical protein RMH26_06220, partial [Polyangiaceae bacterium LLY-WYZ-15_(1-7)]|nr:hypothetical protein [Polyangiaceae bacterium LLY-WYZ-15_(1-7)]